MSRTIAKRPGGILVAGMMVFGACSSDDDTAEDSTAEQTESDSSTDDAASADAASDDGASDDAASDDGASDDGGGGGDAVGIAEFLFTPSEIQVASGTTITFTNNDSFAHTVTSADGAAAEFDSGDLGEGATFEVTLDDPGTYAYF